jgi:hypothetical protein
MPDCATPPERGPHPSRNPKEITAEHTKLRRKAADSPCPNHSHRYQVRATPYREKSRLEVNEAFGFIGTAGFTGTPGQLRYAVTSNQQFTFVQTDSNGDKVADLQLVMNGRHVLTAADFVL